MAQRHSSVAAWVLGGLTMVWVSWWVDDGMGLMSWHKRV